ncbi:hypothetical protein [Haloferula rosea]|uniref:Lipoprotein n=1 Tax=Haloferula rosea TaxID=490093 RepID=A0A934VEQ2_9BACT|nr:hypothetical protein [Haloferula rosea]MBK1826261.1 hypothetical protein [Haloferula rosea]
MRFLLLFVPVVSALLSSCVVERTVTDSSGNVIYQEPEMRTPFEDEKKRQQEVMEKERELGW